MGNQCERNQKSTCPEATQTPMFSSRSINILKRSKILVVQRECVIQALQQNNTVLDIRCVARDAKQNEGHCRHQNMIKYFTPDASSNRVVVTVNKVAKP